MDIRLKRKITRNIKKTPVLQQSSFWSEVKQKQGTSSRAFDIKVKANEIYPFSGKNGNVEDDILILFHEVGDGFKVGYIPYGPTLKPVEEYQGPFLEELSESLRPYLPPKCIMLRYDLLWESLWARDDSFYSNGSWAGPPGKMNQEIRMNCNTQNWNLRKSNTNILPKDTVFIDLAKDEELLVKEMKPKTRYNIRLSGRKGIEVRKAGMHHLDIWYGLYRQTCARNRIFLHDIGYFEALFGSESAERHPSVKVDLLIAELEEKPLAAIFLVYSGSRATYLYGASSSENRNLMATYALQWEAIKRARKRGCTEYDMFGVSPFPDPAHPLYGLYRFKTGFGGELFHRMGCWDYPLDKKTYELFQSLEMNSQGYHL